MPVAVKFIENAPKSPFFLSVGYRETHRVYHEPTAADNPDFILPPSAVPDTPETRLDMAAFHASARVLDGGVGAVLDALEKQGLAANTLVIYTTDHGIAFPDMKCSLTDDGMAVSMMMRGPREFSGGKVCNAMISQIDFFPTICEYLQIDKPGWLEGKSFLPVLRGQAEEINDEIFGEVTYHAAYEPKRAVRTHRLKYVKHFDGRTKAVLPNCDDGPSKTLWLKDGWQQLDCVQEEELYDLIFDRAEKNNLAHDPQYAGQLADMRQRLEAWMRRTNDPLLKGPVPLAAGGHTTPVNAISPEPGRRKNGEAAGPE
jgi:arylsulfatase A-like enzyme